MKKQTQLLTKDQSQTTPQQHKKPCSDCPWARHSLPGWLGSSSVEDWLEVAHSDIIIPCHTLKKQKGGQWQCAGASIYRANVCKVPRDPDVLKLPSDTKNVFSWNEFELHHKKG